MTAIAQAPALSRKFRLIDFAVTLFCLLGTAYSVIMFRPDLFQALETGNGNPVGTVLAGNNAQRLMANWLLWDTLTADTHIYPGDTIRTTDHSGVTLSVEIQLTPGTPHGH